jgi:pilus assembly protein CpaC
LSSRKVQTEVELESGQSFVIAGLLNNQITQQLSRMPGFADIPLLGKLFQSRSINKNNTELMVVVTPELVRPLAAGMKAPEINTPVPFMKDVPTSAPSHPGPAVTGPVPMIWKRDSLPVEELHIPAGGSDAQPPPPAPAAMPGLTSSIGSNK